MSKKKVQPKKKLAGKSSGKKSSKKVNSKSSSKVPLCPPVPPTVTNFKVDVPNDHTILNRLRTIRDKVFASFGIGPNITND